MRRDDSTGHRDRLILLGLMALEEQLDAAEEAALPSSATLRAILSFLHGEAGGDRAPFDAFWQAVRDPVPNGETRYRAGRLQLGRIWGELGWTGNTAPGQLLRHEDVDRWIHAGRRLFAEPVRMGDRPPRLAVMRAWLEGGSAEERAERVSRALTDLDGNADVMTDNQRRRCAASRRARR